MNDFKWRHFQSDIILGCVQWYSKYGMSYRDIEKMMIDRGVKVNHTTIYRWVKKYIPNKEQQLRNPYRKNLNYKINETYVKIKGEDKYLYRAIDKYGTIDFFLSSIRNSTKAKKFLDDSLRKLEKMEYSRSVNLDKSTNSSIRFPLQKILNKAHSLFFKKA